MTDDARPSLPLRIGGLVLMLVGLLLFILSPVGVLSLAALGCGMNTTGCRNPAFPWEEIIRYALPAMIGSATIIWGGWRMHRQPFAALGSIGMIVACFGILPGYFWAVEWYGYELFSPARFWTGVLTMTTPPLVVGAALMIVGQRRRQRWLASLPHG